MKGPLYDVSVGETFTSVGGPTFVSDSLVLTPSSHLTSPLIWKSTVPVVQGVESRTAIQDPPRTFV